MRLSKFVFLTAALLAGAGFSELSAQAQLERVSVTERSDGAGFVVRYHLTQMADSFRVAQPETDRIQMVLYSPSLRAISDIPIGEADIIRDLRLYNMQNGVGVEIMLGSGVFVLAEAYPDVNQRDILLSLVYTDRQSIRDIAAATSAVQFQQVSVEAEAEEHPEAEETVTAVERRDVQQIRRNRFSAEFGIKGGFTRSDFAAASYGTESRSENMIGASVDLNLPINLPLNLKPGIETGVQYIQKGVTNPANQSGVEAVRADYIEIPMLGKLSYRATNFFSPHIIGGPFLGFMVNSEAINENGSIADLDENTSSSEFGGIVGIGADFTIGMAKVSTQFRFSRSLTDVYTEEVQLGEQNEVVSFVVGIRF